MPEGDSVHRFASRLGSVLTGQTIKAARAHGPGPVPQVNRIVGATCLSVRSQGKNLLIEFDNGLALRGHLRMYGSWHVYSRGAPWRLPERDARLVLETSEWAVVNFNAPVIELLESRALEFHQPIGSLGPDLLADEFDEAEALRRFADPAHRSRTIGDAIMDQRIMAGVGNIWKHETLFRTETNPWRMVAELSSDELLGIIRMARQLLLASVGRPNTLGHSRRPRMFVYMRSGRPCLRCQSRIQRSRQGEDIRFTAWCPRCQPLVPGQAVLPAGL